MYRQKHKQRMTLTAVAVLVVPLAAACGSEQAGAGSGTAKAEEQVTGTRWTIDSVTVDGTTHRAPDGAHLTLDGSGRAEGSYGCNTFSADAAVDGDRITLGDTASTEMACDDKPMDVERALSRTLSDSALKSDVNDDRLTLTTDTGDTVRLSKGKDAPLHGTKWTVTTPAVDGRAHLTFDEEEGTVAGRLGCNHVNADATVRDGHITLGVPSLTRMMCEDSLMDAEKALTKLFAGTVDYAIEGRTLTLTSENGTRVRAVAQR
ncbi:MULTISPECIES: META domain-containing protein [unclassified Streptomyces]|uniref:META domain-containing protein n=1 Tax=unclassified Streptomyces TaxID=2593676 RepID=UPI001C211D5F|nr:META domain-containing protein [Streptomyces sp. AC558_RSS880]